MSASKGMVKNRTLTVVPGMRDDMINAGANYLKIGIVIDGNLAKSRYTATP